MNNNHIHTTKTTNKMSAKNLLETMRDYIKNSRILIESGISLYKTMELTEQKQRGGEEFNEERYHLARHKQHELAELHEEPFFTRIKITLNAKNEERNISIGKFSHVDAEIYSWTSPIGVLRFLGTGHKQYENAMGDIKHVEVHSKEDVIFNDGELVRYAYEGKNSKELIFEEKFETHKLEFALGDIVDRMEGYQDSIIRLPFSKSLFVTGPAGSGKTTVALHRIAFLFLYPNYKAHFYRTEALIILKDESAKTYFGGLLPSLGVENARVITFPELCDELRHNKETNQEIFTRIKHVRKAEIKKTRTMIQYGKTVRKSVTSRVEYSAILIDEFQNYTHEELTMIKMLVSTRTRSIMYVGDPRQTIREGAVGVDDYYKNNVKMDDDLHIDIDVSYRNPRCHLEYIEKIGFTGGAHSKKEGGFVKEISMNDIEEILNLNSVGTRAIITPDEITRIEFQEKYPGINVYTYAESMGFEFDEIFVIIDDVPFLEKSAIEKNLLYIALTRSMNGLFVINNS